LASGQEPLAHQGCLHRSAGFEHLLFHHFPLPIMKKLVFATALDLGKEIIANLSDEQLRQIEGGTAEASTVSCDKQSSGTSCSKEVTAEG
jgi:hypothetical protein